MEGVTITEFSEGKAAKIIDCSKGEVEEAVVRRVLRDFTEIFVIYDDLYFCMVCLEYLGRDCPDGFSCGDCKRFYCEACWDKFKNCPKCKILLE